MYLDQNCVLNHLYLIYLNHRELVVVSLRQVILRVSRNSRWYRKMGWLWTVGWLWTLLLKRSNWTYYHCKLTFFDRFCSAGICSTYIKFPIQVISLPTRFIPINGPKITVIECLISERRNNTPPLIETLSPSAISVIDKLVVSIIKEIWGIGEEVWVCVF